MKSPTTQQEPKEFCIKHKERHGKKYISCVADVPTQKPSSYLSMELPSGSWMKLSIVGAVKARDIVKIYKMVKLLHNSGDKS